MMNLNEIFQEMSRLKDWSLEGNAIVKNFSFGDFKQALEFVDKVGAIAEKLNHHPDIIIKQNIVRLILTTESPGEITKIDFDVAKEIDLI
jgi:4a-hydroxytetrahydrobiopterin dehydratase